MSASNGGPSLFATTEPSTLNIQVIICYSTQETRQIGTAPRTDYSVPAPAPHRTAPAFAEASKLSAQPPTPKGRNRATGASRPGEACGLRVCAGSRVGGNRGFRCFRRFLCFLWPVLSLVSCLLSLVSCLSSLVSLSRLSFSSPPNPFAHTTVPTATHPFRLFLFWPPLRSLLLHLSCSSSSLLLSRQRVTNPSSSSFHHPSSLSLPDFPSPSPSPSSPLRILLLTSSLSLTRRFHPHSPSISLFHSPALSVSKVAPSRLRPHPRLSQSCKRPRKRQGETAFEGTK